MNRGDLDGAEQVLRARADASDRDAAVRLLGSEGLAACSCGATVGLMSKTAGLFRLRAPCAAA